MIFFFFNDTATTEIYTLSLHDALPISCVPGEQHVAELHRRARGAKLPLAPKRRPGRVWPALEREGQFPTPRARSEQPTPELQSPRHLLFPALLLKKKNTHY